MGRILSAILVFGTVAASSMATAQQLPVQNPAQFQFDEASVQSWLETKQRQSPDAFRAGDCLNSNFMNENQNSCLTRQAIFLLSEINQRRDISLQALRRTLQITEARRVDVTASLIEEQKTAASIKAEKTENSIKLEKISLANEELGARIQELEVARTQLETEKSELLERRSQLEAQLTDLDRLATQKTEQLDYAQAQILTLETRSIDREKSLSALKTENSILKQANLAVSRAYKDLTDKLRVGLLASLTN